MNFIFLENFILGIFLALPLGPVTLEIINRGLKEGFGKSFLAVLGTMTAELVYFSLVFLGLAKFSESFVVQIILGGMGILFILYLSASNLADFIINNPSKENAKKINPFLSGFNITFFSPLNLFMWAGIIAVSLTKNPGIFSASGVLLGILVSYLFVCLISSFGNKIIKEKYYRWISLISGLFMMFFAIKIIIDSFLR